MSRGCLYPVVGPSGAGKDTLIDAARAARPDIHVPNRWITRAEGAGGEVHVAATEAAFEAERTAGGFAFHWRAHGLAYGIPAEIEGHLAAGRSVVFNGSRGILAEARARFAPLRIIVVTAPDAVLAARLAARGRETAADIAERLSRAHYAVPDGDDVTVIQNDGSVADGIATFLAALTPQPERA
ncbi:MAG: phosphonate metabolism protein/1,5-bisphosphokinase (PRPP-forming) PhnN [Pseudomonadota bacterium]